MDQLNQPSQTRPVLECYMHPEIQRVLLDATKPIKIISGGRSSTKSWSVANYFIGEAKDTAQRFLCARELQSSISASVHQLLKDRIYGFDLEDYFKITDDKIRSYKGSNFVFKGLRANLVELKGLEGINKTWIEEGESLSQDCIDILLPTIMRSKPIIIITFNPNLDTDPIITNFVEPYLSKRPGIGDMIAYCHLTYKDNPYFTDAERMLMEHHKKTDFERYEWMWEGKYKQYAEALVFKDKYVVDDFETPPDMQFYFGADYGFHPDPATLVRCFINNNKLFIDYEFYSDTVEIDQLPECYKAVPKSDEWIIRGDASRPDTISYLNNHGYNVEAAEKGPGSVEDGIAFLRSFEKIVIHPRCKGAIHDFGNYKHKQDRLTREVLPILIDKHNHIPDSLRYALEPYIKSEVSILDVFKGK